MTNAVPVTVTALEPDDRPRWTVLWTAYLAFYETELPAAQFDHTWDRLMANRELHGLGARQDGELVGICHLLFHSSAWTAAPVCYLQDLFTDVSARGGGVGRALIAAAAAMARERSSTRLYWLTQSNNATARALYDKVARHSGFIRYEMTP